MEWTPEALARLEKVPFFIRSRVKKQIEDYVRERGGRIVTDADVTAARRVLAGKGIPGIKTAPGRDGGAPAVAENTAPAPVGLTARELARIEELLEKGPVLEGLKSRYHEVKVCGGAVGCPRALIDVTGVARALARILAASGLGRHLAAQIDGPVLFHHRFRVAVAGCPNSCSQPQIVDFGVTGRSLPGRGDSPCRGCNLCVAKCQEGAVRLQPEGPIFDYSRCLGCGDCLLVCPEGALKAEARGFRVMIGGKLGRHPRLAETILDEADEKQVMAALKASLDFFMAKARKGERFGQLLERTGPGAITAGLRQETGA